MNEWHLENVNTGTLKSMVNSLKDNTFGVYVSNSIETISQDSSVWANCLARQQFLTKLDSLKKNNDNFNSLLDGISNIAALIDEWQDANAKYNSYAAQAQTALDAYNDESNKNENYKQRCLSNYTNNLAYARSWHQMMQTKESEIIGKYAEICGLFIIYNN